MLVFSYLFLVQQRNIERFEFAIDLGTSNTHIEFRKGNEKPEVFNFTTKDRQLCEMFIPTKMSMVQLRI